MSLLIGFLTFILVVNCLFLMLLVLVQLPKKEAGAGLAFGAGAVDTLIGAGSGNALTKMTKYSAGIFLGLAIVIAVLNAQRHQSSTGFLKEELSKKQSTTLPAAPQQPAAAPSSGTLPGTVAPANQGTTTPPLQLTPQQGAATPNTTAPAVSQPANTPAATPSTPPANTGTKQP
jgi:preprotein translocase subunit SecG